MSDETDVTVTVDETSDDSNDSPDVVVVDTGDSGGSGDATTLAIGEQLGALTVTVNGLTSAVQSLSERMDLAEANAAYAFDLAAQATQDIAEVEEAVEVVAEEAVDEATEAVVDEIIEPQREHWLWRKPIAVRRGADV